MKNAEGRNKLEAARCFFTLAPACFI